MHGSMRKILDSLYLTSGLCAALSLVVLLAIVVLQMSSRWLSFDIPGLSNYAGYCLGAASFFGLGYALNYGTHIRVMLLLNGSGGFRKTLELIAGAISVVIVAWFALHMVIANFHSYHLGELSQGQDVTPIWIPQITMSIGSVIFFISVLDLFLCLLTSKAVFTRKITLASEEK